MNFTNQFSAFNNGGLGRNPGVLGFHNRPFYQRHAVLSKALAGSNPNAAASAASDLFAFPAAAFTYVDPTRNSPGKRASAPRVSRAEKNYFEENKMSKTAKKKAIKKVEKKIEKRVERKILGPRTRGGRGPRSLVARAKQRRGVIAQLGRRGPDFQRRINPPVRYGYIRNVGQATNFAAGRPGCLTMTGKFQLGGVYAFNFGSAETPQWATVISDTTSGNDIVRYAVQPANAAYSSTPLYNMAKLFSRYRMKTKLEFVGTTGTNTPGSLKLTYLADPLIPYLGNGKSEAFTFANRTTPDDLRGMAYIKSGDVFTKFDTTWSRWTAADDMKYVAFSWGDGNVIPTSTEADQPEIRQSVQGIWALTLSGVILPTSPAPGEYVSFGELWVYYSIELCDILNTVTNDEVLSRKKEAKERSKILEGKRIRELLEMVSLEDSKEEKKESKKSSSIKSTKSLRLDA